MDARIAMAIFASMTVVLGYFSYGKINMAKDSALLRELKGLHQAVQNYQTDMGTFYEFTIGTSDGTNDFIALYDSAEVDANYRNNWNGPYYTATNTTHLTYGSFTITYGQDDRSACTGASDCYAWIGLTQVDQNVWERVNSFTDEQWGSSPEVAGHTIGNVQADATTDPRTLFYRSVSRKR
jgi:hypothetical protein